MGTALKNLASQVSKLQGDIRECERVFITITRPSRKKKDNLKNIKFRGANGDNALTTAGGAAVKWTRTVHIGLDQNDLAIFRKEWVLLVFLCHQFQLYKIGVHKDIINILYILGEMYFIDLLQTFDDVFHPVDTSLILDFPMDNPGISIKYAIEAYAKDAMDVKMQQNTRVMAPGQGAGVGGTKV